MKDDGVWSHAIWQRTRARGMGRTKDGARTAMIDGKGIRVLRNAVVGIFVAALLAGMFLPVYTDEVGWRFQERAAFDGVDKLYSDTCGPNTLAVPPFFMMPVRYYSAFFNSTFADPFYVRLSGVFYALLWAFMLFVLIRRIADDAGKQTVLVVIGFGLMALGTLPLLLVWSRPEQPIIISAIAALLVAMPNGRDKSMQTGPRQAWWRSGAIVLLGVVAVSYHLKGVFLLPLFLACIWLASGGKGGNMARPAATALLVFLTAWAGRYWIERLHCPDDPVLWKIYSAHSVGAALTDVRDWGGLLKAIGRLLTNLNPTSYFDLPALQQYPMSNWLEANQVSFGVFAVSIYALRLIWFLAVAVALLGLASSMIQSLRDRRLDPKMVIGVVLFGIVLAWSGTQLIRNTYEALFVLPLTMLAILFGWATLEGYGRFQGCLKALTTVIGLVGIGSPLAVASIYAPSIIRANKQHGYIAKQHFSVTVFGYQDLKGDILAAARKCDIPKDGHGNALMIDDLTYFTFMRSRLPQNQLGVIAGWKGSITDPIAYLKGRGSDGIIVGCHLLPDDLRARARRHGAFCCLGPPNW